MKKLVIFLLSLFLTLVVSGQDPTTNVKGNKDTNSPVFIGSENVVSSLLENNNSNLLDNYIKENFVCPEMAHKCFMEGTEVVHFMVNEHGNVSNFKIINSVCPELDRELIRVLKTTDGQWIPSQINGEAVAMDVEVEFKFGIYNSRGDLVKDFNKKATNCYISGSKQLFVKNNPEKALKCYNNGIKYLPNNKALLMMRGFCHYELGDTESAHRDWNRILALGGIVPVEIDYRVIDLNGYEELVSCLTEIQE